MPQTISRRAHLDTDNAINMESVSSSISHVLAATTTDANIETARSNTAKAQAASKNNKEKPTVKSVDKATITTVASFQLSKAYRKDQKDYTANNRIETTQNLLYSLHWRYPKEV